MLVGLLNVSGQSLGNSLGVTRPREATHAYMITVVNQRGGGIGRHDFLAQAGVKNA
jgi:hypothetical protein